MPRSKTTSVETITPEALEKLINKKFGEGTVKRASDPSLKIERIPTGILSLDDALGGGFARGRHAEMFGSYSVGKSYIAQRLVASAQALGGRCAWVETERTFDPVFATKAGVKVDELSFHEQEHGNRVINFMETLLRSGLYDVIVLDSIAALLPISEVEADMEAGNYGTAQAKLMSQALRRLTTANKKTVLLYINQTREAIGVVFGKRSITSGGRAMGFYAGTRLELVRTDSIKRKGKVIDPSKGDEQDKDIVKGHRVLVRIEKDKTGGGKPQDTTTFVFDYDLQGIDPIEDLIYVGRKKGLVHKRGDHWWVEGYEDEKQLGRARFARWLRRNTDAQADLEEWIREWSSEEGQPEEADEE